MKTAGKIIVGLCIVMIAIAAALVYMNWDKVKDVFGKDKTEYVQEISTIEDSVVTIQDILDEREALREERRIDSVFLTMHDVVLIDILMQHGTDLSIKDIVYIYESNNTIYNKVMSGARAQQYRDSLARDSI